MTSETEAAGHVPPVRRYYDNNTTIFERLGQGGASIHRAVWGPGVTTREAAFHHVDDLVLDAVPPDVDEPTIVDLGCGLGASLVYLARRIAMRGEGITISPLQAARAEKLVAEAGVGDRVRCREGSYLSLPDDLAGTAHLAFSIEAFLHSPDADRYFSEAARILRPGGRLVICDDFLTSATPPSSRLAARRLDEFRTGWHVGTLITVDEVRTLAAAHGLVLVRDVDLTAALELRRLRDRWVSVLLAFRHLYRPAGDYWQSLIGGDALQWALIRGLLSYRFLELESRG